MLAPAACQIEDAAWPIFLTLFIDMVVSLGPVLPCMRRFGVPGYTTQPRGSSGFIPPQLTAPRCSAGYRSVGRKPVPSEHFGRTRLRDFGPHSGWMR